MIAARIERLRQNSADLAEAFRREARVPPFYPPIAGVLVGRDGTIWVQGPDRAEGRPYFVLEAGGDSIGTVVLASKGRLGVAERDRIWVVERDTNDVESIVRYRVTWR